MTFSETMGMTLPQAVDKLGIRPLCFGAAWKTVDLLLEQAFMVDGLHPDSGQRWTIAGKLAHARAGAGRATPLSSDPDIWSRLLAVYASTSEIRHSLVHRRATVREDGAIVGTNHSGTQLQPAHVAEQEAFCRAVQCAMVALQAGQPDERARNQLLWHLDELAGLVGYGRFGAYKPEATVPLVSVVPTEDGTVDWPKIREKLTSAFPSLPEIDLCVAAKGEQAYLVRLENAPAVAGTFDPADPPDCASPCESPE